MKTPKHHQNKIQKIETKIHKHGQKSVKERRGERKPNPFVNLIVGTGSSLASLLDPTLPQHRSFNP
jgi:hypothetical protein